MCCRRLDAPSTHLQLQALPYLSDQVIWDGLLLRATNKQDFNKVACLFKVGALASESGPKAS